MTSTNWILAIVAVFHGILWGTLAVINHNPFLWIMVAVVVLLCYGMYRKLRPFNERT